MTKYRYTAHKGNQSVSCVFDNLRQAETERTANIQKGYKCSEVQEETSPLAEGQELARKPPRSSASFLTELVQRLERSSWKNPAFWLGYAEALKDNKLLSLEHFELFLDEVLAKIPKTTARVSSETGFQPTSLISGKVERRS